MSNEIKDLAPERATDSQPGHDLDAPSAGPEPTGQPTAREPDTLGASPDAPAGQPSVPGLAYCANCEEHVEPNGKGHCPDCGRFLPENTVSMTTGLRRKKLRPSEKARRTEIADEFFAAFGGILKVDVVTKYRIWEYAILKVYLEGADAYLDEVGPLTAAGRERSAMSKRLELSARCDALLSKIRGDAPALTPSSGDPITRIERIITEIVDRPDVDTAPSRTSSGGSRP